MGVVAAIRNQSGPVYAGVQGLLAIGIGAAAIAFLTAPRAAPAGWLAMLSLAATVAAASLLIYLRRLVMHRLHEAGVAEADRRKLIETDLMTGAMVRRVFLDELAASIGTLSRQKLLLVELDHFKQLNDSFGHLIGDLALCFLVECMRHCFPDCVIGRLGGDEFGIIMPGEDLSLGQRRAHRLTELLRAGNSYEGHHVSLSASIGIAAAPLHAGTTKELMLLADLALYESKSTGRGRATVFDAEMLSEKRHRRFMERELRAAVYLNELELHYQPVNDADGSTFALEALVRWRHPVRGMIPPGEFIPIAERSSLIDALGEWVFRRACIDADNFPTCRIGINISGEQLKRQDLVAMMQRVLHETSRRADRFVLEITETVATAATPEIIDRIGTLRAMGFRIALDDFGTGHCGFNYIKTLPIDGIKIDRSYVRTLDSDPVAQVFVSALAQIARIQDLIIVAEGIETEAEFNLARAAGCKRFQGYFFGKPAPCAELAPLFNGRQTIPAA